MVLISILNFYDSGIYLVSTSKTIAIFLLFFFAAAEQRKKKNQWSKNKLERVLL
jgi:hypothetical protein